ncbi:MAG: hypothetical protein ABFC24_05455 [Methanoregulaceae archaeon]
MADFVQKTETKTATRELTAPLEDVTGFTGIVENVLTNNPFSCIAYMSAGANHPPVEKTRESYTARIVYEGADGKTRGTITIQAPTVAAFNAIADRTLAETRNATDMGGAGHRDTENEKFSANLKCHDQNGELYNVVFSRDTVRLNSYSDDAIKTKVETWADSIAALG